MAQAYSKTLNVMDDDSAASNGTDLFIYPYNGPFWRFASACANTADAGVRFDVAGDGYAIVTHNADPATNLGGIAVYFDEDALSGSRFMFVNATTADDAFVAFTCGRTMRIVNNSDAATDGVAVHFDDDAADVSERLLFISPTDTDGTDVTSGVTCLAPVRK